MNNYVFTPPPISLMRHWSRFQGDTNPEALWFRIATEAARWGYEQCLGQYENAAMDIVFPTADMLGNDDD